MAKPHEGSRKRVEYDENDPATGNATASSPRACVVQYIMTPMSEKAIRSDPGPPWFSDWPDATNNPVPWSGG